MFARQKWKIFGAAVLLAVIALFCPIRLGLTCGGSMAPTLQSGQPFLIDRFAYRGHAVSKDDVLVFERSGTSYVKRVAAVAGDAFYVIRYLDAGWEYPVDPINVPRLRRMLRHSPGIAARIVRRQIPAGYCYVLGDAVSCSEDSRIFGPIPLESVQGRLLLTRVAAPDLVRTAAANEPIHL